MKRFGLFLFCAAALLAQGSAIRNVYVLPMTGGLDQFLAARITSEHAMQVVADPKAADAVLTDHLGASFEQQLDQLMGQTKDKDSGPHPAFRASSVNGTVFLVDAKSRRVLWSDYEKPSRATPARQAERIVKKLQAFGK
jgi:hypothetical protein